MAALVEKLGKVEVEARVSLVFKEVACTAEEAFCALAECGGDVKAAQTKLLSPSYLDEMKLASEACNLGQYVTTKKKKKRKKKTLSGSNREQASQRPRGKEGDAAP